MLGVVDRAPHYERGGKRDGYRSDPAVFGCHHRQVRRRPTELGWDGEKGKPEGVLAHAAGSTDDGFCVIEWWSSEGAWDKFFAERLAPAFEKVGGIPQPQVTRFEVHASYPAS